MPTYSWPLIPSSAPAETNVWDAREAALWDWVKAGARLGDGTQIPDAQIIFAEQNHAAPPDPFLTIRLAGPLTPMGAAAAITQTYDSLATAGEEITLHVAQVAELSVTVQAYSDHTHGPDSGFAILSRVQLALSRPTVRAALRAAGLFPFDSGSVVNLSALEVTDFEGRASVSVRFYVAQTDAEKTGYISSVEETRTVEGSTVTVTHTAPPDEDEDEESPPLL